MSDVFKTFPTILHPILALGFLERIFGVGMFITIFIVIFVINVLVLR